MSRTSTNLPSSPRSFSWIRFALLLGATLQLASAQDKPTSAQEQAQTYFEAGEPRKALATLAEAAQKSPQDRVIGAMLYAAIRDHVWHLQQVVPVHHGGPVKVLAFNADGTKLASGATTGEVLVSPTEVMDEDAAAAKRVTLKNTGEILGLNFSNDGLRLAVATKTAAVQVWDLAGAKVVYAGPAPDGEVTAFARRTESNLAAIGTASGAIQVLDIAAGKVVSQWQAPGGRVLVLALSRDGQRLAAACGDRTARAWDVVTKKPIGPPIPHEGTLRTVAFSNDGHSLLSGGEDKVVKITALDPGAAALPVMNCDAVVQKVSVSSDGTQFAALLNDSSVAFWDMATGQKLPITLREDAPLNDFIWSRSGLRVATSSEDGHATLWTTYNGARCGELMPQEGPVLSLALSGDSKLLATGSADGLARVWRTDGGMPMPTVRSHAARARTAFYSADGQHLVTTSEDHTALHWLSGHVTPYGHALVHRGKVTCGVFNADATRILTCDDSGIAQLWNAATGNADGAPYQHPGPVRWVDFHPDGKRLVTVSGATATIWSVADRRKPLATITHDRGKAEMKCARFSPDGKWLVTASADGTAQVWNAKTYRPLGVKIYRNFPVLCVRFSPDGSRLVVAGEDAQAAVYDTATWQPVGVPILAPGPVFSAAFTGDNDFLVISSLLLDAVQFFEIRTGRTLGDGLTIPSQATCIDYMPLDKVVAVACDDGTVRALGTPFVTQDVPPWIIPFVERLGGLRKTGPDTFERVDSNLEQFQNYLSDSATASNFDFPRLVRWKLTPGNQRHGMPRFTSTLAANIEHRLDERSVDALYECYDAAPGDPLILGALSLYLPNQRHGEYIANLVLAMPGADPLARCFAAGTLVQAGHVPEAEAAITKALAEAPEDARVLRRAAKFYARVGNKERAVALFGQALKLEPDDGETRRSYAWALYNFGQPAEARVQFRMAEELVGPMNDDLIAGICLCAAALKNDSEARSAFQRLVTLDSDWQLATHLSALRGWTPAELRELERVRQTLYPGK